MCVLSLDVCYEYVSKLEAIFYTIYSKRSSWWNKMGERETHNNK